MLREEVGGGRIFREEVEGEKMLGKKERKEGR